MSVGQRLKEFRQIKNITQNQLANYLDILQSNLHRYESDASRLTTDKLEKLRNHGVNIDWLITGKGKMFLSGEPTDLAPQTTAVKIIDAKVSAGSGCLTYEEDVETIGIPYELIRPYKPNNINLLRVDGRSMEPVMRSGDILVVSPMSFGNGWASERFFVLRMHGELRVKRLQRKANGKIAIISENKDFKEEEISEEEFADNVHVVARVLKVIHTEDI